MRLYQSEIVLELKKTIDIEKLFFAVLFLLSATFIILPTKLIASEGQEVAKAITVRGDVQVKLENGETFGLEEGSWLPEGASVITANRSFAKLLFSDRSQMNVAPNSEMMIEQFNQDDPGMINLVRGRIRSKVTRNYLDTEEESEDSKLFIKTRNAAMGVRGTDFLVEHSPNQNSTNLVTFQGSVAMVNLPEGAPQSNNPRALDAQLNSTAAVRVTQGQASSVRQNSNASAPRPVPPQQMERILSDPSLSMDEEELSSGQQAEEMEAMADTAQEEDEAQSEVATEDLVSDSGDQDDESSEESGSGGSARIPPGMDEQMFTSESEDIASNLGEEDTQRAPASDNILATDTSTSTNTSSTALQSGDSTTNQIAMDEITQQIEDTRREQEDYIRDQIEETVQESRTRVQFILERN